jgi:hypothetical protein
MAKQSFCCAGLISGKKAGDFLPEESAAIPIPFFLLIRLLWRRPFPKIILTFPTLHWEVPTLQRPSYVGL